MPGLKALEPGGHLGRYELLTPIAQGGMATVWAARQTGSHGFRKTVALKTMLPELSEDPQFERMFLAEARLAMRVHHPNVAETLDLGEDAGQLFLVMEWVDGESLSTLLKAVERDQGRMPLRLALQICSKAARGLHAAHEVTDDDDQPVGIVHRDVSPQNIMISFDGHVKVVDFGVAKGQTENGATQVGQFKGKVPYMAPEQAEGEAVDRRTDVFAMGTLLYRLTTGKHPFLGANPGVTIANVVSAEPAPPSSRVTDYPAGLEAVVARCLAKVPSDRYASMAALADELDALLVSMGAPVTEEEIAACAKRYLGELRKQRREAMRDAAKALGWAMATSESLPRVSLPNAGSLTPSAPTATSGSFTGGVGAVSIGSRQPSRPPSRRLYAVLAMAAAAISGAWLAYHLAQRQPAAVSSASPAPHSAAPPASSASATSPAEMSAPAASVASAPSGSVTVIADPPKAPGRGQGRPARPSPNGAATGGKPEKWGDGPDMGF
jgi:serine/threonine-protein kinase